MFRIYKKNKNFVMRVSFVLIILLIISFLNFNNLPYANVKERSDLSDQLNVEVTDTEEKDPKASTDITAGGIYTGITYTDNVWIKTSAAVIFERCTFQMDLYLTDASDNYAFDVTADLCSIEKIYFQDTDVSIDKLVVTNSTLYRISDSSTIDPSQSIELTNCSFIDESQLQSAYIYYSDVDFINCSFVSTVYFRYGGNTAVIDDCKLYESLGFGDETTDITIQNCEINELSLLNGDSTTVQDTVCQSFNLKFNCSIDETLELKSYTPNTILSNVYLKDNPPAGEFSKIFITDANLNVSDITNEILSKLYILEYQNSLSYIENCSLAYYINSDFITGRSVSNIRNCTFMNAWIRSNSTYITDCNFYNILDVDTNPYVYGGSNKPFIVEDSNFFDATIHVLSGGVDINNCDFKTDMGYLWLDTYVYSYDNKKDTFAIINNSNPKVINLALNTSLIAENLDCNSITMRDTSHGIFNNVDVGKMKVFDSATATIDNCHINSHTFDSPNVQITNSIVDSIAPTLDTMPSPLNLGNLKDFILNWSTQPGQNLTGNIVSYKIFRAEMGIGGAAPSSSDFELIHTINNPDPTDLLDTQYNDTELEYPSSLDGYQLYYTVEITDQGGNSGNSSYLDTVYDTAMSFDVLDATVLFDDSLTTYDGILVTVVMLDADINDNGTQDCGNASLHCQFKYVSTIVNQAIEPTVDSINGIVYYFLIPQTFAATEITFSILIEQNKYYDAQGIGLYDFNSTNKYGKEFTIKRPTIAFNPVDHPSEDKILASKRIELSVSAVIHAQYVANVKVYYRVDGGDWKSKSMSYDSEEAEYTVKLPRFDPCTLEYYVKYEDIAGKEDELLGSKDDPETIEIIPDFPQTKLEVFDLGILFIGSALVGIVFGLAYVFLDLNLKKRTTLKRTQKLKSFLDYSDESRETPTKKVPDKSISANNNTEGK
ncbi:MAG: hypothetical protein ACFFDK_10755 [Promethearchaeota archaeon]